MAASRRAEVACDGGAQGRDGHSGDRADALRQATPGVREDLGLPGDPRRARRRRVSRPPRSTPSPRTRWRRPTRSRSPRPSAPGTSPSSARWGTAAAVRARPSRIWPPPSPPGRRASGSPGGRASGARGRGRGRTPRSSCPPRRSGPARSGCCAPPTRSAMLARRYMHEYGATRDHLFNVALACRNRANQNPAAMMYERPLTREMYMTARWISEPLCLFDNCLETDGALACVIVSAERARDCRQQPGVRPLRRPGPARPAPRHGQLLERRPAHRPGLDRRPAPVETGRLRPGGRGRRADLRRVHAADPALPGGLRLLRARRGRARSPRAARWRSADGCRSTPVAAGSARRTSTASTSSTRA